MLCDHVIETYDERGMEVWLGNECRQDYCWSALELSRQCPSWCMRINNVDALILRSNDYVFYFVYLLERRPAPCFQRYFCKKDNEYSFKTNLSKNQWSEHWTYWVTSMLFAWGKDVGRQATEVAESVTLDTDSASLPALNWAICLRNNSNCWLHLWFCSRRCWFCASRSRNLFVTHSLILAAFASTNFASWSLNWRCGKNRLT